MSTPVPPVHPPGQLPALPVRALAVAGALAAVYVLWGSTYLAIRFALESYPPFLLGAIRMSIAGGLMYAVLRWRGVAPPSARQWRTLVWLSIFMVLLSNGLVNLAETEVGSGMAAIAVASMPLFAALFAWLRGRMPTRREWAGLAVGFVGVAWLNVGSELSASPLGLACLVIAPDRLGLGLDLEPRPGPARALHVRRRADARRQRLDAAGRAAARRAHGRGAHGRRHARPGLAGRGRLDLRLHRLHLAAAPRAPGAGHQLCLRQSADRGAVRRLIAGETFGLHDLGAMAVILAGVATITLARTRPPKAPAEPAA
jgi:hypothetical protein